MARPSSSRRPWWGVTLLLAAASLAGCGTPSQSLSMGLSAADQLQMRGWTPDFLRNAIELDKVRGGDATSAWWGSRVSGLALEQALDDSLRGVGMLAPLGGGRYQLQVEMLSLVQPIVAADYQVTATIHYVLVDRSAANGGRVVYQRSVRTAHTADFGDSMLSQPDRARRANEGAVRANIATLLRDLMALPPR
ncbi:hypothetical protein [Roseateles violae]|uniref:Lipoprotein n=1 Tax=Roseateles violae TaxID=3058042 RepID=A0ABT8DLJ7_9BURK|nr:hypothetical protein [Pelomonas sp. PFR6]MDN3918773.1 hypothetical protein [Pelomonas sp. PFR6]